MRYILILALTLLCSNAWATTYTVCGGGCDFANLPAAASAVTTAGDTIHLNAGFTATLATTIDIAAGVNLEGAGTTSVITASTALDPMIRMYSAEGTNGNQEVRNLKFDGASLTAWSALIVRGRSNILFHDNTIQNFLKEGVDFLGRNDNDLYGLEPTYYAIGNKFYNNVMTNTSGFSTPLWGGGLGSLRIGGQDGMLIYGNRFTQDSRGVGTNGYLLKFHNNGFIKNVKIYNNIFSRTADGEAHSFDIELWNVMGGVEIYKNQISGTTDVTRSAKGNSAYTIWFHNNIVGKNTGLSSIDNPVGFYMEQGTDTMIISHNYFMNMKQGVALGQQPSAIPSEITFKNIFVYNNIFDGLGGLVGSTWLRGTGFSIDTASDALGIYDNIKILNNTFNGKYASANDGIILNQIGTITNVTIANNIIKGFAIGAVSSKHTAYSIGSVDGVTLKNNIFYGNGNNNNYYTSGFTPTNVVEMGTIKSEPNLMVDYRLYSASPAVNAGATLSDVTDDYSGTARPWGGAYDIGAYEQAYGIKYNGVRVR